MYDNKQNCKIGRVFHSRGVLDFSYSARKAAQSFEKAIASINVIVDRKIDDFEYVVCDAEKICAPEAFFECLEQCGICGKIK